jgi:ABC-type sugar transport system ATPase subunit
MQMAQESKASAAVVLSGISVSYGATQALADLDLEITAGSVHAFVGENGAGKSTALGVIAGRVKPDAGTVQISNEDVSGGDLRASRRAGVTAVYQELTIAGNLDAAANVFLADPLARAGFLSKRSMQRKYEALCAEMGVNAVSPGVQASALSVAQQQILELMRSVVVEAKVVLMDEPTAPLAIPEREALYAVIDRFIARGVTVIFVSHNLDEVQRLSDRITVFRDGKLIVTSERGELSEADLVRNMLGDDMRASNLVSALADGQADLRRSRPPVSGKSGHPVLQAKNVTVPDAIDDIDVEINAGEVLGLAGLVGSGRTTLFRALSGAERGSSGRLWIEGREVPWPRNVRSARRLGIVMLPEDRKQQGLVMAMSAGDNVVLSDIRSCARFGLVSHRALRRAATKAVGPLRFPTERLDQKAETFSGGNQQKLLMGRCLHDRPLVLLADEPTRGIDIGAKTELLNALVDMSREGLAVAIASSELEEVVTTADRVLVLAAGRVSAQIENTDQIALGTILPAAFNTEGSK